jgi:hypothetical protein
MAINKRAWSGFADPALCSIRLYGSAKAIGGFQNTYCYIRALIGDVQGA